MFVLATNVMFLKKMDEEDSIIFEQTIGLALSPENGHVDLLVMLGHADLNVSSIQFSGSWTLGAALRHI